MKWEKLKRSTNVEDLRAQGSARGFGGGRGMNLLVPVVQLLLRTTVGRIILVLGIGAYLLGYNPLFFLETGAPTATQRSAAPPSEERTVAFVSAVLGQTESVWGTLFAAQGRTYVQPKLVLFRGSVESGCGYASAQVGPFYCPNDRKVYLDLSFFDELARQHHAPGDFAQAYVIAHEIGHHVQNLDGMLAKAHRIQNGVSREKGNAVQVKVELQADCYAGVWAHHTQQERDVLEEGDIEEALNAASRIGDDTLQKEAQGYVVPDAFTHGTSAQRMAWFKRGYERGTMESCETGI